MKITRTSVLTGKTRTKEIDVTPLQLEAWRSGVLIQVAMPHLSNEEREFIKTGCTDQEWENLISEGE